MKTTLTRIVAVLVLLVPALLVPSSAQAVIPYCNIRWGSLEKSSSATTNPTAPSGHLVGVRSGTHQCYDRLVLDVDGHSHGYRVAYVDQVRQPGSGHVVPTAGGARLQVTVVAPAYDDAGRATYSPADRARLTDLTGHHTFKQVTWAGSFEGQSTVGLGVRARLPFRAFTLSGPGDGSRLVVDVARYW